MVSCKWGCPGGSEWWQLEAHELDQCDYRLRECMWGCGPVQWRHLKEHQQELCPLRVVSCNRAGCADRFAEQDRRTHEREHCLRRVVACRQGCGEEAPAGDLLAHMREHCVKRLVRCR